MIRIVEVEQGSPEWLAIRAGKVTGSKAADLFAKTRSGDEGAARRDYRIQLVTERLTGLPTEQGYVSPEMRWGTEHEAEARAAYEAATESFVTCVGFAIHPENDEVGCSPDGLVEWDGINSPEGIVQFKCPKSATHVGYIKAGKVPADYLWQMTLEMICTGAKWCDFVSFDPRFPKRMQLFVARYHRDEERVKTLMDAASEFLKEVREEIAFLEGRCK